MECPKCGKQYNGHPALSREDNETLICPECGAREALKSMGCDAEETEHIIATIKKYEGENGFQDTD